jgi:hypothetical protein
MMQSTLHLEEADDGIDIGKSNLVGHESKFNDGRALKDEPTWRTRWGSSAQPRGANKAVRGCDFEFEGAEMG